MLDVVKTSADQGGTIVHGRMIVVCYTCEMVRDRVLVAPSSSVSGGESRATGLDRVRCRQRGAVMPRFHVFVVSWRGAVRWGFARGISCGSEMRLGTELRNFLSPFRPVLAVRFRCSHCDGQDIDEGNSGGHRMAPPRKLSHSCSAGLLPTFRRLQVGGDGQVVAPTPARSPALHRGSVTIPHAGGLLR
ncbi:hypothetical protein E2C01_092422 [Portunus trituberculatus]|uniref:Uncharacterized protein n=1 Tax=Portunus trituberculatus TaxID=210409 RepID=A0A5B7JVR7_PORTR|nr:hypothetical protein [Portunus trituberculatus]